jgi:putative membrane-bound dehydrogenase-like protein
MSAPRNGWTVLLALIFACSLQGAQDKNFVAPPSTPLTPRDEQMTFKVSKGFTVDLVASEPDVIDPVHLAFDENGRLFVAEMIGYPNDGVGAGTIFSGRIRMLEDKDGDGVFETSRIWADNLRFPMGLVPYKGGLLVANAPDLLYLEDPAGVGKATKRTVLYTGFDLANIQQLLNSLTWGVDNWVYAVCGSKGGDITCPQKPDMKPVPLRGRGLRFKPDQPGSLEPTSGGGQYGLTQNEWGDWFVNTNSQHLRHIVLDDHYLARNPNLPVSAVTLDIPDHGAACKVYRISPFEAWRVERTRRRKGSAEASRFPSTELVPGGFITSACSPLVYLAELFPKEFLGNTFICDPANNLIHRDKLAPKGATYSAQRVDIDCEFLASTDTWFRPVHLTLGPDGAIYIADFYREVIETPLSLPEDMKKVLPLKTQDRGRIWRVRPEGKYQAARPALGKADSLELVSKLAERNAWWRITAQRLLVERQDESKMLHRDLAATIELNKYAPARIHALWTLHELDALPHATLVRCLKDDDATVRFHALRVSESYLGAKSDVAAQVLAMADDESAKVRHQLAFTLGALKNEKRLVALAAIAGQDIADPWTQTAVLNSTGKEAAVLLESCLKNPTFVKQPTAVHTNFAAKLAGLVGSSAPESDLAHVLPLLLQKQGDAIAPWQIRCLEGVGQGLFQSGRSLEKVWQSEALAETREQAKVLFAQSARIAKDEKQPLKERLAAVRLISFGPFELLAGDLAELLTPQQPPEVQLAAVRGLAVPTNSKVGPLLLAPWGSYSPAVRREATEALLARPERVAAFLDAIESKQVLPLQIEPSRLDQLRKYPNAALRARAVKLLAGQIAPARQKVIDEYKSALDLTADAAKGKLLFKKVCATCHRLENVGVEVGADLQSALSNKTPSQLLIDILDPSREVDPRFLEYSITTTSGRVVNGLIAAETASSVTLRRAEKQEETILRSQIDTIQSTTKSLMPDGLEQQLNRQDLADVIAYLQAVVGRK